MPDVSLDLDAVRERANQAREVWNGPDTYGFGPQVIRASATDVPALLAEIERLRAESVPRSALVQVGWQCNLDRFHKAPQTICLARRQCERPGEPIFAIREQA